MNFMYATDIISYALSQNNEPTDGTGDYAATSWIYLNRSLRSLAMGGGEFNPATNEAWWWLKSEGSLILNAQADSGTVNVTNNSNSITFSTTPSGSLAGYFFKVEGHNDVFRITAHTTGTVSATLDTVYTGSTASESEYVAFDTEYTLATDCIKLIGPMQSYSDYDSDIELESLNTMQRDFPLHRIRSGRPEKVAPVSETTVRFNRFATEMVRVDYDYISMPTVMTSTASDQEPEVPLQYRHILGDMTAMFIAQDKDDAKAAAFAAQAKAGIDAMTAENKARWAQAGNPGQINPRQGDMSAHRRLLRTKSGVYIR